MIKRFPIIITAVFVLITYSASSQQSSVSSQRPNADARLASYFYKKLTGKIGDIPIVMHLTRQDSVLSGTYYYAKIGAPLALFGEINSRGKFSVTEFNQSRDETGSFSGSFLSDTLMQGIWTNAKTNRKLSFFLSQTTNDPVTASLKHRHSENCNDAIKNKKKRSRDVSYLDTLCTTLDLDLIEVAVPSVEASRRINASIVKSVCGLGNSEKIYTSVEDLMNSVHYLEYDIGFELSITCEILNSDNGILSISVDQELFNFGAAHGSAVMNYYNFDIRTGRQITLEDLLKPNYEEFLDRLGERKFIETNGSEDWDFEKGQFKLNRNFAIMPGGLLFSYDHYEIGPYFMGSPKVFIPYKEFDAYIKPNGLLELWRRK